MIPPHEMPPGGYVVDYLAFWFAFVVLCALAVLWVRRARRLGVTTRRLIVGNLLVVSALLAGAVLAGETYLRYVYDETDSYGLTVTNAAWFKRHWHINEHALRDVAWPETRRPNVKRILVLGDSFAAGYGVPDAADRFSDRMRAELARRSPGEFEVWNGGVIGWSTGQQLSWLQEIQPRYGFDHVVLAYCLNDADDLLPENERFDRLAVERPTWIHPWQSFLFDFLWFRLRLTDDPRVTNYFDWVAETYRDGPVWQRQRERLESMADYCARRGVRLDVVVFPFFDQWGPGYTLDEAHERVVAACRELDLRVLDLREAYRGIPGEDLVVNEYDAHPNERAHAIAAEEILAHLLGD